MDANIVLTDLNMFDGNGNLLLGQVFTNSWFFGIPEIAFIFIMFVSALLLNRYGFSFGTITGIIFLMALVFATISGNMVLWGIVVIIGTISGLRLLQTILIRIG